MFGHYLTLSRQQSLLIRIGYFSWNRIDWNSIFPVYFRLVTQYRMFQNGNSFTLWNRINRPPLLPLPPSPSPSPLPPSPHKYLHRFISVVSSSEIPFIDRNTTLFLAFFLRIPCKFPFPPTQSYQCYWFRSSNTTTTAADNKIMLQSSKCNHLKYGYGFTFN